MYTNRATWFAEMATANPTASFPNGAAVIGHSQTKEDEQEAKDDGESGMAVNLVGISLNLV